MNPSPLMTMLETVIVCGFKFCNTKVQVAELPARTLPKLKGVPVEQPETLDNVGALTPDPSRITESELICKLALYPAVEAAAKCTVIFSVCDTAE